MPLLSLFALIHPHLPPELARTYCPRTLAHALCLQPSPFVFGMAAAASFSVLSLSVESLLRAAFLGQPV